MSENKMVRVGVGCWVFNPKGQLLLGQRLSQHGFGTWAPPGGKLEFGEELQKCAARELEEETGIVVSANQFRQICVTNDVFPDKHYITLHYVVTGVRAKPKLMEHNKCAGWLWFDLDRLPTNLFLSAQNLLNQVNVRNVLTL